MAFKDFDQDELSVGGGSCYLASLERKNKRHQDDSIEEGDSTEQGDLIERGNSTEDQKLVK